MDACLTGGITCVEYQAIAIQAPAINEERRATAIRHISGMLPCYSCIKEQTAFQAVKRIRARYGLT